MKPAGKAVATRNHISFYKAEAVVVARLRDSGVTSTPVCALFFNLVMQERRQANKKGKAE